MNKKLKITYLLESCDLWGGNKVIFEQAEALSECGHDVLLVSKSEGPSWYDLKVPLYRVNDFDDESLPHCDIIVGTYWTTVKSTFGINKGRLVHLCQGYEGANIELSHQKKYIDEVYSYPIPRLIVSSHLKDYFPHTMKEKIYYVGQMVNREIFRPASMLDKMLSKFTKNRFQIIVVGPFEGDVKNIATTLRGINIARQRYRLPVKVVRVSQFPLSESEREILIPDFYYCHVPYKEMGRLYRRCDLSVSLSKEAEGFGLPAVEAMACGVPVILSNIPSFTNLFEDAKKDYALFVDYNDYEALADCIYRLFKDKKLRRHLIKRGLEVANNFKKEYVLSRLNDAFYEIVNTS